MRLPKEEFIDLAPSFPSQVRVNHDSPDCQGSSKSMSIRHNDDGSISAKCFRCGGSGYLGASVYKPSFTRSPIKKVAKKSGIAPNDTTYDWDDFPPEVVVYLHQCGLNETTTKTHKVGFSSKINRLVIPVNNLTHGYVGYITKSFDELDNRYYTNMPVPRNGYNHIHTEGSRDVVVVEDVLSGIRAGKLLSTFSLCGTELLPEMKRELLGQYDTFYLWLDNDNTQVKMKQLKIKDELSILGDVNLIYSDKEPKHCTDEEIYDIIYK